LVGGENSVGMLTVEGVEDGGWMQPFLQLVPLDLKTMTNDQ
jgi:hypothetical protein